MRIVIFASLFLAVSGCTQAPVSQSSASSSKSSQVATAVSHESKLAEVKKTSEQVSIGMRRFEVELLFEEKDGGLQGPSVSRYYEHPEVMIEIPFDQTGGNWSKNNRVTGEPNIYRSLQHSD